MNTFSAINEINDPNVQNDQRLTPLRVDVSTISTIPTVSTTLTILRSTRETRIVKNKDLTPKTLHKKRNLPRSGLLEKQVKANRDKYEHDRQG
jgi:hypothetical protein